MHYAIIDAHQALQRCITAGKTFPVLGSNRITISCSDSAARELYVALDAIQAIGIAKTTHHNYLNGYAEYRTQLGTSICNRIYYDKRTHPEKPTLAWSDNVFHCSIEAELNVGSLSKRAMDSLLSLDELER